MGKQIVCDVKFNADGTPDRAGTFDAFQALYNKLEAQVREDHDSVAVEAIAFFVENPGLKTIASPALVRALWERKIEAGLLKGKTQEEKGAMYARLEEVVPEWVKANPDMFHMGRKTGIAVRYVPGDIVRNEDGSPKYDPTTGNEIQAYRHSDEEWAKLTAKKAAAATETANAAQ